MPGLLQASRTYGKAVLQSHPLHRPARPSRMDQELLPCITQSKGSTWGKEESQHCARGSKYMLPACRSSSPTLKLLLLPFTQLGPWAQLVPGQTRSKRKE